MARVFWRAWFYVPNDAYARGWCYPWELYARWCHCSAGGRTGFDLARYAGRGLCRPTAAWILDGHYTWIERTGSYDPTLPWTYIQRLVGFFKMTGKKIYSCWDLEGRLGSHFSISSLSAPTGNDPLPSYLLFTPVDRRPSCYHLTPYSQTPTCHSPSSTPRFATITKRSFLFVSLLPRIAAHPTLL